MVFHPDRFAKFSVAVLIRSVTHHFVQRQGYQSRKSFFYGVTL